MKCMPYLTFSTVLLLDHRMAKGSVPLWHKQTERFHHHARYHLAMDYNQKNECRVVRALSSGATEMKFSYTVSSLRVSERVSKF